MPTDSSASLWSLVMKVARNAGEVRVTREMDWAVFEKAVDITAAAVRGTMGGEGSQPPAYAAEVFRQVWGALKEASADLPDRGKPGF